MASTSFGKYRLIAELGHGGMADVFLAVQAGPAGSGFRKLTVVKRLRQNLAEEPEFVAMLVDEARIAARLNHPNVVQTNEVGQVGNQYFIAMEYLDGQPLHRIQHRCTRRVTDKSGPVLAPEHYYVILLDTLAGLHHAHELADYDGTPLQIVHRDVTPHNIFVTYAGQVKVVDFGIAKAVGRASETRQGVVKGKVRYMAPEQALGQSIDRRADIFAAGVMLWEAATNRRMWREHDELQIVQALVTGALPPSPREVVPEVPEAIDRICQKALQIRLEDRYATAEEFRLDLEQFLMESGKLVEARRQVAPLLSDLFADKRAEIRNVIEQQLAAIDDSKGTGEFQAVPLGLESNHSNPTGVSISVDESGDPPTRVGDARPNMAAPPPGAAARRNAIAIGAVGLAVLAGASIWRASGSGHATTNTTTGTPSASATAESTMNQIAVHVTTTNSPHATLRIDDGPKRKLPVDLRVARDSAEHTLTIEADGFSPRIERFVFDRDVGLEVQLDKIERGTTATRPPAGGGVTTTAAMGYRPPVTPTTAKPADSKPPETKPPEVKPEASTGTHAAPQDSSPRRSGNLTIDPNDPWGTKKK